MDAIYTTVWILKQEVSVFSSALSLLLSLAAASGVAGPKTDLGPPGDALQEVSWMSPGPPQMNVKSTIAQQSAWAVEQKLQPVVYVGAKWCEPCERFKDAVKRSG